MFMSVGLRGRKGKEEQGEGGGGGCGGGGGGGVEEEMGCKGEQGCCLHYVCVWARMVMVMTMMMMMMAEMGRGWAMMGLREWEMGKKRKKKRKRIDCRGGQHQIRLACEGEQVGFSGIKKVKARLAGCWAQASNGLDRTDPQMQASSSKAGMSRSTKRPCK
ncbi:hypothetical protein IF2G_07140 [Cordyceps javanica]|nr:hypothetical protein IF2G_07140 [Cordyceps javanica]